MKSFIRGLLQSVGNLQLYDGFVHNHFAIIFIVGRF